MNGTYGREAPLVGRSLPVALDDWTVESQNSDMIVTSGEATVYGVSSVGPQGYTIEPYTGSLTSKKFGKWVRQTILGGSDPIESPEPTWSTPYTPLQDDRSAYAYHGPKAETGQSLFLPEGWTFDHKIYYSETVGLYKTMARTSPAARVKRMYDDRWKTDEKWTARPPQEDPGEGGGGS
ncbi:MAG: hypothetical protein KIS66_09265 [Fimbriimonadaceae bacterium]|nr:hypothetical protein [Fimbriimonadaceae bacterium]